MRPPPGTVESTTRDTKLKELATWDRAVAAWRAFMHAGRADESAANTEYDKALQGYWRSFERGPSMVASGE